ncbi:MAG: vitamin B12 dependent-methionine synthase activation domain-containing protein [Syntrophobacteria bacterium]
MTEQKKLFSVFDAEEIGVELLDSCLMEPRKSISGVFGIAPPGSPPHSPCLHCREKNCTARRT